jgi:hypothetical protein
MDGGSHFGNGLIPDDNHRKWPLEEVPRGDDHTRQQVEREQRGRAGFGLEIYRISSVSGLTGTVGPAATPGQAAGTTLDQLFAVINTNKQDEISDAFARTTALEEFYRYAAGVLPPASFVLYGGSNVDRELPALIIIGNNLEIVQRIAKQNHLVFSRLDIPSREFEERRILFESTHQVSLDDLMREFGLEGEGSLELAAELY